MTTADAGTAGLTQLYGDMTSIDRVLRALRADGVDVEHPQARDLYQRDLDCQNLGAYQMLEVIATAVAEHRIPEATDTVLDVGCGMGGPTRFLADRFGASGHRPVRRADNLQVHAGDGLNVAGSTRTS